MMEMARTDRYSWWRGIRGSTLTPTARHVALTIATYMDKDGAGAWPSLVTLADDTGRSRATVARAVRELRDHGYVEVESGGGRRGDGGYVSNRYVALAPANGVTDDMAPARNSLTGDTDSDECEGSADAGTVSPEHGAVSPQHGTVSPATGSGVTHETRTTHELPIQEPKHQPTAPDGAKWPDGWTSDHPKVDAYVSVLRRLEARLPKEWDVLKAEGHQVQKLRNAAAKAADEGVDPYRLANIVTAKPLDGLSSYSAGLAKRIEDAVPTIAGGGPDAS